MSCTFLNLFPAPQGYAAVYQRNEIKHGEGQDDKIELVCSLAVIWFRWHRIPLSSAGDYGVDVGGFALSEGTEGNERVGLTG